MLFGVQRNPMDVSHQVAIGHADMEIFYLPSFRPPTNIKATLKVAEFVEQIPVETVEKIFKEIVKDYVPKTTLRTPRVFLAGVKKILLTDVFVLYRWIRRKI